MPTDPNEERDDRNVYGGDLQPCSHDPETGYLRDGHCRDVDGDVGRHRLCAVMTEAFLAFGRGRGNDLTTPRPEFGFPGLEPGDRWCVCVDRWLEAVAEDVAPPVVLEATSESVLRTIEPDELRANEFEPDADPDPDPDPDPDADSDSDAVPDPDSDTDPDPDADSDPDTDSSAGDARL